MLLDPPQAIPNAAYYVYRYLRYAATGNRATKAQIIRELAPSTLVTNDAVCRLSLDAGTQLGLWTERPESGHTLDKSAQKAAKEQDDALIVLTDELVTGPTDGRRDLAFFRRALRRHIFAPAINRGPWLSQAGAYDFTCAMAWLLAQDVANPPGAWDSIPKSTTRSVQQLQIEQLGNSQDVWLIRNQTRWDPFVRWASYLGMISRQVLDGRVLVVPSPVDAVEDALPPIFRGAAKRELSAAELVGALAAELPVVDGGTYRQEVMTHLAVGTVRQEEGQLSSSLSHALLILHQVGTITLEDRADAPKLGLANGPAELVRFSHARLNASTSA
jgi:hypothetical protein